MTGRHVVVVGHGMVGARLAEEISRHDPAGHRVRLTILAAEPCPAYNRVLLPSLLSGALREEDLTGGRPRPGSAAGNRIAGTDKISGRNGPVTPPVPAIALRTGTTVNGLDPVRQTVGSGGGDVIGYDDLVLATGARAVVPPLPGLLGGDGNRGLPGEAPARSDTRTAAAFSPALAADVAVLRSLADARRIAGFAQAARRTGRRIVMLGGGVLGLEAARALAARGTEVTVVHRGTHPMERQLDGPAGRVLAAAMRRTGVAMELGVGAASWESGRGLWLADGRLVPAAALVLCTGAAPETALARAAGLRLTESGAVSVDDTLATSIPGIYAIGDCAGHPGAAGGLVQPGWEQAAVLASRLTGASVRARYRGSGTVTRLKAAGIELTCLGAPLGEPGDAGDVGDAGTPGDPGEERREVLRFEDPARERYAKLVLARDRVVGAILIGLPDAAAGIIALYDRDARVPADRLAVLLGRALPPAGDDGASRPSALPDYAVVCRCNMVTKGQIRDAWYGGACSRAALSSATRAATGCGSCRDELDAFAAWLGQTDPGQLRPDTSAEPASESASESTLQSGDEPVREESLR